VIKVVHTLTGWVILGGNGHRIVGGFVVLGCFVDINQGLAG
jgi:hypothetical protein